jgi:hypothetical protein
MGQGDFKLAREKVYNPSRPRVIKWGTMDDRMAGDINSFVDDGRASGQTVEHTWSISRHVSSRLQYLGVQDASRKRRPPTRPPGVGVGSVFSKSELGEVTITVTVEKW